MENRYKILRSKEDYFADWDAGILSNLNDEMLNQIYHRYCVKYIVFNRDNFTCQNENCLTSDSPLTLHHIKFQKNGGEDKVKNCISICDVCHKAYHKGRQSLTFSGMTYKIHKDEKINWKELFAKSKEIRKNNREHHGYRISWQMLELLLKFLERNYNNDMDD